MKVVGGGYQVEPTTPRATTAAAAAARPAKHRRIGGQAGNDEWRRPGGVRSSPSTSVRVRV
ncbi:hypothetical protein PGTUg99_029124 [Puccinia graminis f. sp. tritici]|uniref:Uncharacterized protein n=1 Tax=Puccinia graminis f. sp. tritici TaxID=56615 RepID=A0A5B0RVD5_PUCGR|nr:hypothetical protein PGTUg99_029124 [Puccinia graminis f. sp. tritici]